MSQPESETVQHELIKSKNTLTSGRIRGGGGEVVGWMSSTHKVFLSFLLEDKTAAPDVFSSCSFIPHEDFGTSLVLVSCYGYEI